MVSTVALSLLLVAGFAAAEVYYGSPARIEDFPSIVQIENGYGPVWVQVCVGVILTNRHVLSVAHCFYSPSFIDLSRFRQVRAGANERGRDGVILPVESANNHPDFGISGGVNGDITIVRLGGSFTFGSTIQQGSIINSGVDFPANVPVTIAGWGRTAQDAIWANRDLHSVGLFTIAKEYCVSKYASLPYPITITDDKICSGIVGANGHNLGIRDGGAPVFYDGILMGLVTFGSPYGESYPLVLTAVSPYTSWIVANAV